jgi:hypothetical protein
MYDLKKLGFITSVYCLEKSSIFAVNFILNETKRKA